jgi:dual specificity phosphatase 12
MNLRLVDEPSTPTYGNGCLASTCKIRRVRMRECVEKNGDDTRNPAPTNPALTSVTDRSVLSRRGVHACDARTQERRRSNGGKPENMVSCQRTQIERTKVNGPAATMSISTTNVSKTAPQPCRIVVMGAQRARVQKVLSILKEQETDPEISESKSNTNIHVEYLACVAKFDSYEDAQGQAVRYLVSIDYYGHDGSAKEPGGLISFFDGEEKAEGDNDKTGRFFGAIAGVAIGVGIEDDEDVTRINTYFKNFTKIQIPMECARPNPEFATMKEETASYIALNAEAKEEVTRLQSMGPGKMAKFASDLAKRIINNVLEEQRKPDHVPEPEAVDAKQAQVQHKEEIVAMPHSIDPEKNRYSCRKCRLILFGDDDLEDPPHIPSNHGFSYRKMRHSGHGPSSNPCQSLFLAGGMDWMGDVSGTDGKLCCSKCATKVGNWNWSGAQCSCGSWVVPAIQVPNSKVDLVAPRQPELPAGTIISPTIQQLQRIG